MTYAVIELSGSQFLVSEGDKLKVNRLAKDEGKTFSLTPLLLVSNGPEKGRTPASPVFDSEAQTRGAGRPESKGPTPPASASRVLIGQPYVGEAKVELKILEHKKDKKIEVRRFKSKSRYRRKKGHRQQISLIEVVRIKGLPSDLSAVASAKAEASVKEGIRKGAEGVKGLEELKLSTRTKNALEKAGIKSAAELRKLSKEELQRIKGIGDKAVEEIAKAIK